MHTFVDLSFTLSYTSAIKQRYIGIPYPKKKSGGTKKIWGYQKNSKKIWGYKKNLGYIHTPNMVSQLNKNVKEFLK